MHPSRFDAVSGSVVEVLTEASRVCSSQACLETVPTGPQAVPVGPGGPVRAPRIVAMSTRFPEGRANRGSVGKLSS